LKDSTENLKPTFGRKVGVQDRLPAAAAALTFARSRRSSGGSVITT